MASQIEKGTFAFASVGSASVPIPLKGGRTRWPALRSPTFEVSSECPRFWQLQLFTSIRL